MPFDLAPAEPAKMGFHPAALERLCKVVEAHIAENKYPGAQIALARHGKLVLDRTFGNARLEPAPAPARNDTLWLLYSNTKVITAAAVWLLVEDGSITFHDRIADHVPEFARHGKGEITLIQLLTHQAGFPSAAMPLDPAAWEDHALLRKLACDFTLEWAPGSRVHYHALAAHWVAAVLIEAVTGTDYRAFIRRRVIEPLGLGDELHIGLSDEAMARCADMHTPAADGKQTKMADENTARFRRAGVPGAGGYATARAMAAFYQMMVQGGRLGATRLVSPRMVQFVTRNFTADRVDGYMGMPMHRGLGPHSRGMTEGIRGLGSLASPASFGHGGVGSSYCWGDPETGVSFAYLTNSRVPDPWHSRRLDIVSSMAHAAIDDV